jgi:transposase
LEDWQDIRERRIGQAEDIKQIRRETGFAVNTIRKYTRTPSPPERTGAPTRTPLMAVYEHDVDELLRDEPKITSARIAQILRAKYATFTLGERAVRVYVARRRMHLQPKEAFIRQVYTPGDQIQYDFKDVKARIAGVDVALHMFTARLSYSTAWFGRCYNTEDRPALFDGILRASVEFGGVPRDAVFDNATTAVDKVHRGRLRSVNKHFAAFTGALGIHMQFAAPAKGNEKGGVEGAHGYIEDNFFRPLREAASLEEINDDLLAFCRQDRSKTHSSGQTIGERLDSERRYLRDLPNSLPRPCVTETTRVTKFCEIRYKTNRYSVPDRYVGRNALIEIFADTIRVVINDDAAAEHPRLFGRNGAMLDPMHLIEPLKRKHRAVERAEVFNNEHFPQPLRNYLTRLVKRDRDTAGKQFLRVMELLSRYRLIDIVATVTEAHERGVDDPAAIELLLSQNEKSEAAALSPDDLPAAAKIVVSAPTLREYAIGELKETAA